MREERHLGDVRKEAELAERLQMVDPVARYDNDSHREAWAIAHAFSDLEESFEKFSHELLPKLMSEVTPQAGRDILLDIGEEFRQVLYHLSDLRFYRYLHNVD
jgi:hypothetical protein